MTPEELEKLPKPLERTMTALEMDIMLEVVNRIRECSQITPVTDWLLNRMTAIGMSKKRIKEILQSESRNRISSSWKRVELIKMI